ncbi:MAG: elongation factor G [Planctomycetes bacterium]|nr:elongation factor G [Planctomycetota bacterium]
MTLDLRTVRNVGIAAHIDAGKTTTTERILYYTGRTHRMGEVDDGTTTTDFDEQEQKRGITIFSAAVSCPWRGHTINLIDTPGHVDFTAEVERSLRVLDGVVAVFDAREGVEAQSETVWRQADRYGVPRLCFINKMDRIGADFEHSVQSIRDRLHAHPLVVQLPIGSAGDFQGLIDLIDMVAVYYRTEEHGASFDEVTIPPELVDAAQQARRQMIEALSETSEGVMEKYLHDQEIDASTLRAAIRQATIRRALTPVLCGSALRYIGVQRMLDAACDYLPCPLDLPPLAAADAARPEVKRTLKCDPGEPVAALVFKVVAERPVDLYYLRVYSGTLKSNSRLLNTATGEKENISRIYRMFAKRRDQLDAAVAGEIVAVIGPKSALTGHTLCDARRGVVLEPIKFPETVISVSIEARSSRDRDKLLECLKALTRQDPTLAVATNPDTGQTLLSGMGELHLEVNVHRLKTEMNVDVAVGKPRVSYRETVTQVGEAEGRFDRQIGGRGHFAVVRVRLEPRARVQSGPNFEIVNPLSPEELPVEFQQAIRTGITDAAHSGILGGYSVIDWKATVAGVEKPSTESSEVAFENAARVAFYQAMRAAGAVLLQPIMEVEVVASEEHLGVIIGDLNARDAVVRDTMIRGNHHVIRADVPLAQMFGYVTKLRSLSQGRATATMAPSHYAPVPADQMKVLVG